MNEHSILITALLLYAGATLAYLARMKRAGTILIFMGITLNTGFLAMQGFVGGDWYFALTVNELLALPAFEAMIVLYLFRTEQDASGRIVAIALVLCSLAAFIPVPEKALPSVKEQVLVAPLFFLTEAISMAFFSAGIFMALAELIVCCDTGRAIRQCILWGFVVFTLSQVLGAVWAFIGWSYPFSWSARHLASASTWCLYAAILHAPYMRLSRRLYALLVAMGLLPISFIVFHHELSGAILVLTGGAQ